MRNNHASWTLFFDDHGRWIASNFVSDALVDERGRPNRSFLVADPDRFDHSALGTAFQAGAGASTTFPKIQENRIKGAAGLIVFMLKSLAAYHCNPSETWEFEEVNGIYSAAVESLRKPDRAWWEDALFGYVRSDLEAPSPMLRKIVKHQRSRGNYKLIHLSWLHPRDMVVKRDGANITSDPEAISRLIDDLLTNYFEDKVTVVDCAPALRAEQVTRISPGRDHSAVADPDAGIELATPDEPSIDSIVPSRNPESPPQVGGRRTLMPQFGSLPSPMTELMGRDSQLEELTLAWKDPAYKLVVIRSKDPAFSGGIGKTALVKRWLSSVDDSFEADAVFGYSFYNQGQDVDRGLGDVFRLRVPSVSSGDFLTRALTYLEDPLPGEGGPEARFRRLLSLIEDRRTLLVIDGLEAVQYPPEGDRDGRLVERSLSEFLQDLAYNRQFEGLCVLTTRYRCDEIEMLPACHTIELENLDMRWGKELVVSLGVQNAEPAPDGMSNQVEALVTEYHGHPLALVLVAAFLSEFCEGDPRKRYRIPPMPDTRAGNHSFRVVRAYERELQNRDPERRILQILGLFGRPEGMDAVLCVDKAWSPRWWAPAPDRRRIQFESALVHLRRYRLVLESAPGEDGLIDMHPLVRDYFRKAVRERERGRWNRGNAALVEYHLRKSPVSLSQLVSSCTQIGDVGPHSSVERTFRKGLDHLLQAIYHACAAGQYLRALALLTVRVDESTGCPGSESRLTRELWLFSAVACTRPTMQAIMGVLKREGRKGRLQLGEFYRDVEDLDKPVRFYLASKLHEWELRLSIAQGFYPQGYGNAPAIGNPFLAACLDMATARCLAYLGLSREAIACGTRAYTVFSSLSIEPLAFLAAYGVALIKINTCELAEAHHYAGLAARWSLTKRQRLDAQGIQTFIRDLQGELTDDKELSTMMADHRPSTRLTYFYLQHLVRHSSLDCAAEALDRAFSNMREDDEYGVRDDLLSVLIHCRMFIWFREVVEGRRKPRGLLEAIRTAYEPYPDSVVRLQKSKAAAHYNRHGKNCYHRIRLHLHEGRAARRCAEDASDTFTRSNFLSHADHSLDLAASLANWSGYLLLKVDVELERCRLRIAEGDLPQARNLAETALAICREQGYGWGREEALELLERMRALERA